MFRTTELQKEALGRILDGQPHTFGPGYGSYRVALRALHHKAPLLVAYARTSEGKETFTITSAGHAYIQAVLDERRRREAQQGAR